MSNHHSAIRVAPIRAFADNYIWLIESLGAPGRALVVDPGDAAPVEAALDARGVELAGILLTHHHPDHIGGVAALLARTPVPVYGADDARTPAAAQRLHDGERIHFADLGLAFETYHLPGHTISHIGFVGHGALFCGDTLFSAGCGRLFEGNPDQMNHSLTRLAQLAPETRVYCAHEYTAANLRFALNVEPANESTIRYEHEVTALRANGAPTLPSTIDLERRVNPFLRCGQPAVQRAAASHAGWPLGREAEVFAVLRAWKDGFR